jgi:tetratricopeptide (TPR) repeat protein
MARYLAAAAAALTWIALTGAGLQAIRPKAETAAAPKQSPEAASADAVNDGLKRLAKADQAEARNPRQARRDYEAALQSFQTALKLTPDNYRAHTGAGYAYRKLGNFERALESYERALKISPAFSEAIEYRAEAYLGLNRLDEARQAYMHLFVNDRTASHVLMKAMKVWVERHRTRPAGVDAVTFDNFASWVSERDALAAAVVNLGHNSPDWK